MEKIILYYKFTPIKDPQAVMFWQRTLCEKLDLKGRIVLSEHGINGTLGGKIESMKAYIKETKQFTGFKGIRFKWTAGNTDNFPKLSVKVRDEIVTFGVADEIRLDDKGIVGGGEHLKPEELHKLIEERPDDVVFFDGRNAYEAEIGKFKNAVVSGARHTRDFKNELKKSKYEKIKDKAVVTYCTGGIRCEVLSMMMKKNGFGEVYQLDGGIVKYGEKYKDGGYWEGSLYVFDGRINTKFSDKAVDIGKCIHCGRKTSNYENCALKSCNNLVLICEDCITNKEVCSDACQKQLTVAAK